MSKSGIYKILNTTNNKFYIGSSINLGKRLTAHKSQLHNNKHANSYVQYSFNRGDYFEFIDLEYCSPEKLVEREQYWIDNLRPEYNLCPIAGSPNLGKNITAEHKNKISQKLKGIKRSEETKAKMSAWQIGRKMSDEAKHNMFKARLGNQSRRLKSKWPCADGCACQCKDCRQKRKDIKKQWDDNRKEGFAILNNIDVGSYMNV